MRFFTILRGDQQRIHLALTKAAIITDPTALFALTHEGVFGPVLASFVRCSNVLLKCDVYGLWSGGLGLTKRPTLYQKLIVAKYNHDHRRWKLCVQGAEVNEVLTPRKSVLQRLFGNVNRIVVYEPTDTGERWADQDYVADGFVNSNWYKVGAEYKEERGKFFNTVAKYQSGDEK